MLPIINNTVMLHQLQQGVAAAAAASIAYTVVKAVDDAAGSQSSVEGTDRVGGS